MRSKSCSIILGLILPEECASPVRDPEILHCLMIENVFRYHTSLYICPNVRIFLLEVMDELETTSLFSSILDAPVNMENQYAALAEVFCKHSPELPDHCIPEPNSEGMIIAHTREPKY